MPREGKIITINIKKENTLIIRERFSAVFVQNPTILSDTDTKLGSVTATIHSRSVGIVSINNPDWNFNNVTAHEFQKST